MTITHRPVWTLAVASAASFMNSLDTQVMATALPTLRRELGGSVEQLAWTMNAYSLAIACLLLTTACLGDRFGRRRMLTIGLVVFAVSSVAAALSPDPVFLIAARTVQGAGAAAIMPMSLAVISEAYAPERRGRAIGIWGAILGIGGTLGPVIGGGLLELVGWRGIFWINVPIGITAAIVAILVVRETYGRRQPLDIRGVLLASAGCFGIAWGLVRASSHHWNSIEVWLPIALGLILLTVFVSTERRARYPMMPTSLFAIRRFRAANAATLLHYAGVAGAVFFLSQFFQLAQGADPVIASLEFMAWPLPVFFLSPLVGSLLGRFGTYPFLVSGMVLQAIGMAWLALVATPTTPYFEMLAPLLVAGIGLSCFLPTISTEIVGVVPRERMSIAAGVNSSLSQIGVVLGVAIVATVFIGSGGYGTPESFTAGFIPAIWTSAAFAAAAALSCLLGRRHTPTAGPLKTTTADREQQPSTTADTVHREPSLNPVSGRLDA